MTSLCRNPFGESLISGQPRPVEVSSGFGPVDFALVLAWHLTFHFSQRLNSSWFLLLLCSQCLDPAWAGGGGVSLLSDRVTGIHHLITREEPCAGWHRTSGSGKSQVFVYPCRVPLTLISSPLLGLEVSNETAVSAVGTKSGALSLSCEGGAR